MTDDDTETQSFFKNIAAGTKLFTITTTKKVSQMAIKYKKPMHVPGWLIEENGVEILKETANRGLRRGPDPITYTYDFPKAEAQAKAEAEAEAEAARCDDITKYANSRIHGNTICDRVFYGSLDECTEACRNCPGCVAFVDNHDRFTAVLCPEELVYTGEEHPEESQGRVQRADL